MRVIPHERDQTRGNRDNPNWVIRLDSGELAGYVQATVHADGRAGIAYVLASKYWGHGIASRAVATMMGRLKREHGVHRFHAVLKPSNGRSLRLLQRLGFVPAPEDYGIEIEPGELPMVLPATASPSSQ
jgi:RimJ/RimL family protein N-acetyltransferase